MSDLVEQLRNPLHGIHDSGAAGSRLAYAAADEIERLLAVCERLRHELDGADGEIQRLRSLLPVEPLTIP